MEPINLCRDDVLFLMIDIQEKLMPAIENSEQVGAESERLLRAADVMNVPLVITEQYPKGLGSTLASLRTLASRAPVFSKTGFSCYEADGFEQELVKLNRKSVVLFGVETHICVLSTAMELRREGYQVVVVGDACGSRKAKNHEMASAALLAADIAVLPTETVVYQLLERSGTPEFKALLPYFK